MTARPAMEKSYFKERRDGAAPQESRRDRKTKQLEEAGRKLKLQSIPQLQPDCPAEGVRPQPLHKTVQNVDKPKGNNRLLPPERANPHFPRVLKVVRDSVSEGTPV